MKNEIREAYDRMNPSPEAKERMMRNMMKNKGGRKREYTAAPINPGWWSAVPAMLMLVAILAVGWKLIPGMPNNPLLDLAPPVESTEGFLFVEPKNYAEQFAGMDEKYQEILVTYAQAIDENWSEELWRKAGLNPELYSDAANAGYSLMDLDGNGEFELLICAGNEIYEIYGILGDEDRQWVSCLLNRTDVRVSIQLCENNIVRAIDNGDRFGGTYYTMYRLGNDGLGVLAMVSDQVVFVTAEGDWYAGPYEKDAVPVSEAEANAALKKYADAVLPVTLFADAQQLEPGDGIPQGYAHILEKYIRAHKENWSAEEYSSNDLSYVLGMKDSIWEYGYAFMDLNSDNVDELLITDGEWIYDLYMLMEDGGAGHLLSGGERMRYFLCEDNIIGYQGSSSAVRTAYEYNRLLPNGDFRYEVQLEYDEGTWYKYEDYGPETPGGVDVISAEQAEQILGSYEPVNIIYQTFLRAEAEKTEDTSEVLASGYDCILDKYAKAAKENWTKEQYMQNDISYMLASKNIYWQYGYAQTDLNGDGSKELIITDGEEIYDVYMLMPDGGAGHILSATEKRAYSLCKNNIIGYHSFGGNPDSCWEFSRLLPGGDTEIVMYLQKDADGWFKMEGSTDKMVTISHDEADEIIATYWHTEIPFQTILRAEDEPELKYPRSYVQLLRNMMSEYSGLETMDVAFKDVTGDGEDELLLGFSGNDSFGHVYSVVNGKVEEILTYGSDIDFTLCKDSVICHHQADDPFGNYIFISLKSGEAKVLESLQYDKASGSWIQDKNGTKTHIKQAEKQEIVDSYGSVSVQWIPVLEAIGG